MLTVSSYAWCTWEYHMRTIVSPPGPSVRTLDLSCPCRIQYHLILLLVEIVSSTIGQHHIQILGVEHLGYRQCSIVIRDEVANQMSGQDAPLAKVLPASGMGNCRVPPICNPTAGSRTWLIKNSTSPVASFTVPRSCAKSNVGHLQSKEVLTLGARSDASVDCSCYGSAIRVFLRLPVISYSCVSGLDDYGAVVAFIRRTCHYSTYFMRFNYIDLRAAASRPLILL
ncbi:hypothetical protein OE88DRAFT_1669269 [Heliocybe sulcata]|uniref:Uncharacterized protein n=1 Tax=Heliocybe sulcata TaxID=5364 RepID=A0A5C3MKZ7_9AGAM|nr:hypothetical protein OE88DRAFT_1669269 [Heliocybe sulcata]